MSFNILSPQLFNRENCNGYTMITKEKEIENDRERILKRFRFNHKSKPHNNQNTLSKSAEKTVSETKYQNKLLKSPQSLLSNSKPIRTNLNIQSKSAHKRNKHTSLSSNIKQGKTNLVTTKDITRKTNQSSLVNSHYSEDTEKESKSHLMLVNNKLSNDLITNNCNYDKLSNESLIEIDRTQENRIGRNNYLPTSNENSLLSSEYSKSNTSIRCQEKENDNYIHKYNQDNIMLISYSLTQAKHRKMQELFSSNPNYNMSNRFINDEINKLNHIDFKKDFKFMREVKEDNDQFRKIKLISFLKMSDYSVYTLLSFVYESFNALVLNSHKFITTKINLCMNNIFEGIVRGFKEQYSNIIQLEEFYFKQKSYKRGRSIYPTFDLVLKTKITTNECYKSYEIGYSYVRNSNEYNQQWRFEIKDKGKDNMMWLASEVEIYNKAINHFCYSQSVNSFTQGDVLEFRMNIFSRQYELNPFSIKWKELIIDSSSKGFYQKSLLKCPYPFDALYACEIENMVHIWKSGTTLENQLLIEDFKRYFIKHFIIKDVVYDYSKIFFYKFRMKADKEGRVKRNPYVNFDIEILNKDKPIRNEIQALGLLNSSLISDCLQIRKGTSIVFYITDLMYD